MATRRLRDVTLSQGATPLSTTSGQVIRFNGSGLTAPNFADPVNGEDLATKDYVDISILTAIQPIRGGAFLTDNVAVSQTIAVAGTAQKVLGLTLFAEAENIDFGLTNTQAGLPGNEARLGYEGSSTRVFCIHFSAKVDATPTDSIGLGLFQSGIAVPNSYRTLQEGSDYYQIGEVFLTMGSSETVQLGILNETSTNPITLANPQMLLFPV